jgi:hypothetical protein
VKRKIIKDNELFMVLKMDTDSQSWAKRGRKYDERAIASYCINCACLGLDTSELSPVDRAFIEPYIRKGLTRD